MATFYIKHTTKYSYNKNVIDGATLIRLHPINDEYQKVISHYLTVTNNTFIETFKDFYNNRVGTFMLTEPHKELVITSDVEIITFNKIFPDDSIDTPSQWLALKKLKQDVNFIDFLHYKPFSGSQEVKQLIESKNLLTKSPYKAVLELCEYIYQNFKYIKGITNVDSSIEEVWKLKAGVCQDFTLLLLQIVRMLGIPARYVSGYICPSDIITRGEGATHAWIEAYIPFYGWLGIDPTNNAIANENHVRLAVGRHYNDCSPVKGVFKGKVEAELQVTVDVSTSKNMGNNTGQAENFIPVETDNSFQQNLERIQQQQIQQ
jgi:transglutaminase-like putative cysteine protease